MLPLLSVKGVTKSFGGLIAVDDVSFDVEAGEIVVIIGPNGAGKTTLFNLISGFMPPEEGEVLFEGAGLAGRAADSDRAASVWCAAFRSCRSSPI